MEGIGKGREDIPVGKIKRVSLREVWKHEALDFTTWFQENMDVVSDATNGPLEEAEREQSAGLADLFGEPAQLV